MMKINLQFQILSTPKRVSDFSILLLSLLIVIFESPILSRNVSNVLAYGLIGLFLVININLFFHIKREKKFALLLTLLYLAYIGLFKILKISSAAYSYYSTIVKFLFFFVVFALTYDFLSKGQKKILLTVILAVVLYTLVDNIGLYLKYGAYRYVYLFQKERFSTNSVNTVFVSALLFMAGTLFVVFLNEKNRAIKISSLALVLFLVIFSVAIAQRTIILLLSMILFPVLLLENSKQNRSKVILIGVGLLFISILPLCYEQVLRAFAKITDSSRVEARVEQLINMIADGMSESSGSGASRISLMLRSVKTMVSSPLHFFYGAGDHRTSNDIIGNHSQMIDEFARYGLFGGLLMLSMLRSFFQSVKDSTGITQTDSLYKQLSFLLIMFIVRGFFGNVFEPTMGIQMFLFIPIVFDLLWCKNKNSELEGSSNI